MPTTRKTLLQRVRDHGDRAAWEQFFALYAPLLESYARAHGIGAADAEEIRDACLAIVVQRMPTFEYERAQGTFQGWLHRIAKGKIVDFLRRPRPDAHDTDVLGKVPSPDEPPDELWLRRWRAEHLRFALAEASRGESEATRRVFDLVLSEDLSVAEIQARTGMNANQVYKARSRLLGRLRDVLRRLGEEL